MLFYALPSDFQSHRALQFLPQAVACAALAVWAARNTDIPDRLGLRAVQFGQGFRWGVATGLILGVMNAWVILRLVPALGGDVTFLRDTPHAQISPALMRPWVIVAIAILVELNFRGFVLGRLVALATGRPSIPPRLGPWLAVGLTALTFSFDPFMMVTFQYLHWIAVWDGIVWGALWIRLRNLYAPIVAHAVEVMVMYSVIKMVLNA